MYKIGDFSLLSRVTVKALRFYDELGLLKPARIDDYTGYRYYTADQLPKVHRILALKDLGLSLEQIGALLQQGLSPAALREMLRIKQAELQLRIGEERALLERVQARLLQIEQEDGMSNYDVTLKKVEPMLVASLREVIAGPKDIGRLFGELFTYLKSVQAPIAGPDIDVWYDLEYREQDVDAAAVAPLARAVPGTERIQVHELPGVETMACTVHRGSYNTLCQANDAVKAWIASNGYQIVGPSREVYLYAGDDPTRQDDESYVTEVQFPVEKA